MPDREPCRDEEAIIGLYLLFARLLNEEPTPELREILLQPAVLEVFSKADPDVAKDITGDWDDSHYEEAAVTFCDTFILPDRSIQPRAAAWLKEGDSISPDGVHSVVESFLEKRAITLPDHYTHLPLDHASVLFFVAATLRGIKDPQAPEFEEAALGSWIHSFGRALQKSESALYRALGRLIEAA